jgi:ADP-ribose pyrophosphatase
MPLVPTKLTPWRRLAGPAERVRTGPVAAAVSTWEKPDGSHRLEALSVSATDWCNVVAVTRDDEVVLVRQFRFGIATYSLETPGGVVDPGETAAEAAVRELFEETGYRGSDPVALTRVHPNPAMQANEAHGFLVQNASFSGAAAPDHGEDLEVVLVPASQIPLLIAEGVISHALIVVTLQAWLATRAKAP